MHDDLDDDAQVAYDDEDDLPKMLCPNCRGTVTEDTQKCPHCGDWITPVEPTSSGRWRWPYVVAVVLMILSMVMWIF